MAEKKLTEVEEQQVEQTRDKLLQSVKKQDPDEFTHLTKWYAGKTNNVVRRFVEHHVSEEKDDLRKSQEVSSQKVAEAVEKLLQDKYGMKGEPSGGEGDANVVYVYKMVPHTEP